MKYTPYLKNIIYLFILQSCCAMEKKITPFKNKDILFPGYTFFSKKCIYSHENNIPCLTNSVTGQTITIDTIRCNSAPLMYDNGTKLIFKCNDNTAKIYDLKKNKIIYSLGQSGEPLLSVTCSLFDNNIVLISESNNPGTIDVEIYKQNRSICNIYAPKETIWIFHPKKSLFFSINPNNFVYKYHSIYVSDTELKYFPRSNYNLPGSNYNLKMCRTSSDGFIAIRNRNLPSTSIIHLDNINQLFFELVDKIGEHFLNMLFYPKGSVLAIMSYNYNDNKIFMRYWDVIKKEYIETVELSGKIFSPFFYFSYNGKKIILPYDNKMESLTELPEHIGSCIDIVPFKVRYKYEEKEKFLYLSLVLNRIILQQETLNQLIIPQDIVNYIKKFSLKLFKR